MTRRSFPAVLVLALGMSLVWYACSSGDDAADLAEDLANRLTEALDFDGGEVQEGQRPPANLDAEHPQITGLSATSDAAGLTYGETFTITLTTDFTNESAVTGAVAWVENSTEYLKITPATTPVADGQMILTGTLYRNWKLGDRDFVVRMAMMLESGEVGNYETWGLSVRKPAGEAGGCVGDCTGGEYFCVSGSAICYCMDGQFTENSCAQECEEFGGGTCDTYNAGEFSYDQCMCNQEEVP